MIINTWQTLHVTNIFEKPTGKC